MEGFWTVQFKGVQGFGTGVVVYIAGHVFGGDSAVMFTGTYNLQGDAVAMRLHVKQMVPGLMTVMGRTEYDLDLAGTLKENSLKLSGKIPGTEDHLSATLIKQCDLPPKA